jgi:hypothetical protein
MRTKAPSRGHSQIRVPSHLNLVLEEGKNLDGGHQELAIPATKSDLIAGYAFNCWIRTVVFAA